jgi:hypothetical protein
MYAAQVTTDDRGGRGDMIGIYEKEADATTASKGRGWYGGDADVYPVSTITLPSGQTYLLRDPSPITVNVDLIQRNKDVREQARQKLAALGLTEEERKLLGITDRMIAP